MFVKGSNGRVQQRAWAVRAASYQFIKCLGCEAPSLLVDEYWTETANKGEEAQVAEARKIQREIDEFGFAKSAELAERTIYPKHSRAAFAEWTHDLSEPLMLHFWETYQAIEQNMTWLAMIGLRAIVDEFCNSHIGDIGGMQKKLKALAEQNFINKSQFEALDAVAGAGNASAHRGFRPQLVDVKECMKVVEHLVSQDFFSDSLSQIRETTPRRGSS
ncbi:DUF4145 domain-containing protein [Salinisphaera sp. S4-8]|uniref:DUF4145 domain-containing protein n=1 Tax=Salinisphaera sp. S4-8 TaxID=633357 RepID=UPI0033425494